jgi:hypothetical protein
LKDEVSVRDHVNAVILQGKNQDQSAQRDEAQKSKNNNPSNKKDNLSKKRARKCVCDEIHEFDKCSYIVSSTRKPD